MTPPIIGINTALETTIDRDPNLSLGAKSLFHALVTDLEPVRRESRADFVCYAELIQRNYIWIENFVGVPQPSRNRTSMQIRLAGLKQFFTGKPE